MDRLRIPPFVIAAILLTIAVLVEIALAVVPATGATLSGPGPGRAIAYLALVDGLVLYTIGLIVLSLLIRGHTQGRIQGVATLVASLLVLSVSFTLVLEAIRLLSVMITLLQSVPFGTIKYFEKYADFDVKTARIILSLIMILKLCFAGLLALSQPRFLDNKGLVLIVITAFVANIIVAYLHGLVPSYLVSITDDIAAIVVAVLAAIWAVILLVGSIPAILRALRKKPAAR